MYDVLYSSLFSVFQARIEELKNHSYLYARSREFCFVMSTKFKTKLDLTKLLLLVLLFPFC